jgi:hypothetical protein
MDNETKYLLMTTEQVSPATMAEWLSDSEFAKWVEERKAKASCG